jgi:DNA (cytosine-5)-methyltransferase 1
LGESESKQQVQTGSDIDGFESVGDATNTKDIGRKNALENGKLERGRFRFGDKRPTWDSFPSQSPICGGDDGLPTELDGITFSKWRAESMKGYGNAIVPQIAYQLFQIIQELNENN